jgi:hypothetical protein
VRNTDVDVPANTIRAWVIGMLLCTLGSGVNMLFSLRNPNIVLTTFVIQLIAHPIGLGWDLIFPDREFKLLGLKFNLKPGPFNMKEHVVIVVMSNVCIDLRNLSLLLFFFLVIPNPFSWENPFEYITNIKFSRPHMVVVHSMPLTLSSPRDSGMAKSLAGHGRYYWVLRLSALVMVLLD